MAQGTDISGLLSGLNQAQAHGIPPAIRAVDVFGEQVIGNAQQLAPILTGALQASGTTEPAKLNGNRISKTIGFNTNYAAAVHERLDVHHDQGRAKYLEIPLRRMQPQFAPFVAAEVKKEMR